MQVRRARSWPPSGGHRRLRASFVLRACGARVPSARLATLCRGPVAARLAALCPGLVAALFAALLSTVAPASAGAAPDDTPRIPPAAADPSASAPDTAGTSAAATASPVAAHGEGADGGGSDGRLRTAWFPILMTSPETGFGAGAGCVLTRRDAGAPADARPQSLSAIVLRTARSQTIAVLSPDLYTGDWRIFGGVGYSLFPDRFYGVGNDAPESAEESYTLETVTVQPWVQRRMAGALRAGFLWDLRHVRVEEREEGGKLDPSNPAVLAGHGGGWRSGLGPVLTWDTRDHLFYPRRGAFLEGAAVAWREALGSEAEFEGWTLDARRFVPAGAGVLAARGVAIGRSPGTPFDDLPKLGDTLRGIFAGRFRDRFLLAAVLEYRRPLPWRLATTLFAGAGDVARSAGRLEARSIKAAGGAGIRIALDDREKIYARIDVGASRYGTEVYIAMGEAF